MTDTAIHATLPPDRNQALLLALFSGATVFLVGNPLPYAGWPLLAFAAIMAGRVNPSANRYRWGALIAVLALLALAPIDTDRNNRHFFILGTCFTLAVFGPYLAFRFLGIPCVDWRFWPRRFAWRDIAYTLLSIPLAWGVIEWYFFHANPYMPTQWPMPAEPTHDASLRLFIGINAVGIWDELFFINIVFATLRSMLPLGAANLGQAVVYTSVLHNMAFTGVGPGIIFLFALTQGLMYEASRCLLYVILVHIIVDAFLVSAILRFYYPGQSFMLF